MGKHPEPVAEYVLEDQVGFLLRRANQRHLGLFGNHIPGLTATQFAALAKLCALGHVSQNALGRATAMDAATVKGVVDRLRGKGYVTSVPDEADLRRVHLSPTAEGLAAFQTLVSKARAATDDTLAPLTPQEQQEFLHLLAKLT